MSMEKLHRMNGAPCNCGKEHTFSSKVIVGRGVIASLPEHITALGGTKAYVISDNNTYAAAAEKVCAILKDANFPFVSHVLDQDHPVPSETSVGSAVMHYTADCDVIVGVGSGVINDISKIVAAFTKKPYIIVGTAPSMDGYASATSSVIRDGLKISLNSKCADVIIGDADILCNAPLIMMKSGLGDMLAKYISIAEWRISHLITGEYYCEEVADLMRSALKKCVDNAEALLRREEEAVLAVFEGLVIGGVAMNYAGLSRPASGVEHYISHLIDMRAVEFKTPEPLHGISCAIGTLIAAREYEKLKNYTPNREKALLAAEKFDLAAWNATLRSLLGKGAESMIALEHTEKKYDVARHKERLNLILNHWDEILAIVDEEIPTAKEIEDLLNTISAPASLADIDVDEALLPVIFAATKDIRDKYILSRLLWDLGDESVHTAF